MLIFKYLCHTHALKWLTNTLSSLVSNTPSSPCPPANCSPSVSSATGNGTTILHIDLSQLLLGLPDYDLPPDKSLSRTTVKLTTSKGIPYCVMPQENLQVPAPQQGTRGSCLTSSFHARACHIGPCPPVFAQVVSLVGTHVLLSCPGKPILHQPAQWAPPPQARGSTPLMCSCILFHTCIYTSTKQL